MKKVAVLFIIVMAAIGGAQNPSPLANLASTLQPGSWAELVTTNIGALNQAGTDGNIVTYSANAGWDPVSHKLVYAGSDHINSNTTLIPYSVIYDETANAWQQLPQVPWGIFGITDHGYYEHLSDGNGRIYRYGTNNDAKWFRFDVAASAWTALPINPTLEYSVACCGAAGYFPALGGFVYAKGGEFGGGTVYLFSTVIGQWSKIADNIAPLSGSTFMLGAYSSKIQAFLFGQNGNFYKLDSSKTLTRLANPPVSFYDGSGWLGNFVEDPVSQNFVFLTPTARQTYSYDPAADTWQAITTTNKPNLNQASIISAGIPSAGVILYTACNGPNCKVYEYRHSPGTAPVPSPTPVPNPTPVPPPPSPTPSPTPSDFLTRCSAAGVVKCVGFDAVADLGTIGGSAYGKAFGEFHNGQNGCNTSAGDHCPVIDNATMASGGGSLKMSVAAGQVGSDSGQWFTNFANDYSVQFGQNEEFYVQYRWRADAGYMAALSSVTMKQDIIGTGSTATVPASSCTGLEFVTQNNNNKGVYGFYQNCGRYEPLEQGPLNSPYSTPDFLRQNAMPNPPGCWHYGPATGCFPYYAAEWVTVQKHVKLGPLAQIGTQWFFTNSHLDVWAAREGQPPVQVLNFGPYNIGPLESSTDKYGQAWLLMYSGTLAYPQAASTWYDDLIISRNRIADPSGAVPTPVPTPTPTPVPPPPEPTPAPTPEPVPQPPPPDPCQVTPLAITGLKWPTSRTGTRSLTWNSSTKPIVGLSYSWPLNAGQRAVFTDDRGCQAIVMR